ncbi:hypothetical protein F4815DRAFT_449116 [Daldinia loculata]|nr:hypothetical protein F4815DRAFT_449116 [Daldinia loculata]
MTSIVALRALLKYPSQARKPYAEHKTGPFTISGMQSHAYMPTPNVAELLDKFPRAQAAKEEEYYDTVRSILESPERSSMAWLMFLTQTNLHDGGKSFVGTKLLPENFASLGCAQSLQRPMVAAQRPCYQGKREEWTENIRIVDANIFPVIPRGNILSLVYAVAEKAADIIKGY